jgi:hypothetical protein
MAKIFDILLVVGGGAALWYAYQKGYLDDIVGKLGGLGGGGETVPEAEDPCIAECASKSKLAFYDYYGYATKKEEEEPKEEEVKTTATAAKCDCSKYETPAAAAIPETETKIPDVSKVGDVDVDAIIDKATGGGGSSGDCKKKFGGKCTTECKSKSSSKCKECEKACGSSSKLALAYMGSYYDGQVRDTAYYVTDSTPFIPRTSSNILAGIAIA